MKVAITGGIGSGKSYVCMLLAKKGIDVYDCDAVAKRLMRNSVTLQNKLAEMVDENLFENGKLQKRVLASFILESEENKQKVNSVIHPTVADDFLESSQSWLESAILFESKFNERIAFDYIICVTAPVEVRVQRIVARDGISAEKAMEWILCQMSQEEMSAKSNFVIVNDGVKDIEEQIDFILRKINK